jgi:alginate O-acetyltransferase complex protein AlgI
MIFSSLIFLCVFLPVVFLLHWLIPSMRVRNFLLIIASLLFYSYGEPIYVLLILFSAFANYLLGRVIGAQPAGERPASRKAWLVVALVVNLVLLGVFKYAGFLANTADGLLGLTVADPHLPLPIGISFYTFQAISYIIDVYRREVPAQRRLPDVLLYLAFFPQLIAGPIIKYHDIATQLRQRSVNSAEVARGMRRLCVGLAKKVLIANTLAVAVDALFSAPSTEINALVAWIAALAYLLQIYYDFSGYSDMAIGMAQMFGFRFKENFNYPYKSGTIKQFWRRWHISLSTWFKEYLYIPLGGNRQGKARASLNKLIVFFCTGLWHGASWTFVVWGLFHGLFLLLEDYLPIRRLPRCLGHLYALLVVTVGFVLFRADDFAFGLNMIAQMFSGWWSTPESLSLATRQLNPLFCLAFTAGAVAAFDVPGLLRGLAERLRDPSRLKTVVRPALYAGSILLLVLSLLFLASGQYNPFIYYRF